MCQLLLMPADIHVNNTKDGVRNCFLLIFYEKLAKFVRLYPCVYNKSWGDFKDVNRKKLCWKMLQRQLMLKVVSGHFYNFVIDHLS